MVSTTPPSTLPITMPIGEHRVVFHNLSWQAYEQILTALPETRAARLTYYNGALEITMPLEDHEFAGRMIELFIRILIEEWGMEIKTMGSTTLKYPHLSRSPEPDNAYYIQNQPQVVGRTVVFEHDPPPDLIVEVDITHTDIDKNALYAGMGVPEFWRYNSQILRFYQLQDGQYVEVEASPTFPIVPKARLYEFLDQCRTSEVQASKDLRQWVKQELQND